MSLAFFILPQKLVGRGSSSQVRSCSQWNKCTITKTKEDPWWYIVSRETPPKSVVVWKDKESKSTATWPGTQQHLSDEKWMFQQDSLAVHKPKTTQDWPPYLSDLNPMYERPVVDFRGQVCAKTHKCLEWLKQSLCLEWDRMSLEECDDSVESFKTRLNPYIRAKGGHFKTDWICDYQRSILLLLIVDFPKFDVITEI